MTPGAILLGTPSGAPPSRAFGAFPIAVVEKAAKKAEVEDEPEEPKQEDPKQEENAAPQKRTAEHLASRFAPKKRKGKEGEEAKEEAKEEAGKEEVKPADPSVKMGMSFGEWKDTKDQQATVA